MEITWNISQLDRRTSDGKGDYIAAWDHPTLPRPTDEQLNSVGE